MLIIFDNIFTIVNLNKLCDQCAVNGMTTRVHYVKFRTRLNVTLYVHLMYCFDVVNNDSLKVCEIGPFVRHVLCWILLQSEVVLHNEMEREIICNYIHCVCIVIFL
jgi:hypothetical protein